MFTIGTQTSPTYRQGTKQQMPQATDWVIMLHIGTHYCTCVDDEVRQTDTNNNTTRPETCV